MIKRIPICHPDRPYEARGRCSYCYHHEKYLNQKGLLETRSWGNKIATCHPDRINWAKGLCRPRYKRDKENVRRERKVTRMRRHSFTEQDEARFQAIMLCDWCNNPFKDDEVPDIDHDAKCCLNSKGHCRKCLRGFVHKLCNCHAISWYEWQEREFGITDPKLVTYRAKFENKA